MHIVKIHIIYKEYYMYTCVNVNLHNQNKEKDEEVKEANLLQEKEHKIQTSMKTKNTAWPRSISYLDGLSYVKQN